MARQRINTSTNRIDRTTPDTGAAAMAKIETALDGCDANFGELYTAVQGPAITGLTDATLPLDGSEVLPLVQGSNARKATAGALAALLSSRLIGRRTSAAVYAGGASLATVVDVSADLGAALTNASEFEVFIAGQASRSSGAGLPTVLLSPSLRLVIGGLTLDVPIDTGSVTGTLAAGGAVTFAGTVRVLRTSASAARYGSALIWWDDGAGAIAAAPYSAGDAVTSGVASGTTVAARLVAQWTAAQNITLSVDYFSARMV